MSHLITEIIRNKYYLDGSSSNSEFLRQTINLTISTVGEIKTIKNPLKIKYKNLKKKKINSSRCCS